MKSAVAAIAFAATAVALPTPQAGTTTPLRFGGMALRSASPIHFGQINANGLNFYIGTETATYCPEESVGEDECTSLNSNNTIFTYLNGQGTLGLDTTVPGGQTVYVSEGDEDAGIAPGQLKFTQAHSAGTSGSAVFEGFAIVYDAKLEFEKSGWLACPTEEDASSYQIFAASRVPKPDESCLGFSWEVLQINDSTPGAWQYTK